MNFWTYVSLGMLGIGLLMLFIVDRIVQALWKAGVRKNRTTQFVDGITR